MIRSACRPASFINLAKCFKNLRVCSTLASSSVTPKINVSEPIGSVTEASVPTEPIMRKLASYPLGTTPKQAWLETMSCIEHKKLGLLELHPDIFATYPRVDILWENYEWQKMYRKVDYRFEPNRAELRGGGRKPWPQKGSGRARHGSIRSPLFVGGGKVHGPRGPKTYFSILDTPKRVLGLRVALTYKHAQNNLHIVEDLNLPTSDPQYLEDLIETKGWGLSVLFIDDCDIMPENITIAASEHDSYNIMPLYGLNVWSMLLHETLVITRSALESLESKLLQHVNAEEWRIPKFAKTRGDVRLQ